MDAAIAAVKPSLDQSLPTLAECNIFLSPDIDPPIQQLAHLAAKQAMDHSRQDLIATPKAFPFQPYPLNWGIRFYSIQTLSCHIARWTGTPIMGTIWRGLWKMIVHIACGD